MHIDVSNCMSISLYIAISFIYIVYCLFIGFVGGLMLVIGEKFVVAGFWSSRVLSDDQTHVPKMEPDVAHLFRLGGNFMYMKCT